MTIRILGIDPGLQHMGWGIIKADGSKLSYVDCGAISPSPSLAITERLKLLHNGLTDVIARFQPDECAIEETFVSNNASSSLKLGQARGAILLTLALANLPVNEYAPNLIKKSVVGVGRAEKHQVQAMVKLLLPGCILQSADAADSLAVAICHHSHRAMLKQIKNLSVS